MSGASGGQFPGGGATNGQFPGGGGGFGAPAFIPGTLVRIPDGMTLDEVSENFDANKFGVNLPTNMTSDQFGKVLKGENTMDFQTQELMKGLNPGKFGPMSQPYQSAPGAGMVFDNKAQSGFGSFLKQASTGQPGHDWIATAQSLEAEGKYKEAAEVLSDPKAPFANIPGAPPNIYKAMLDAKATGGDQKAVNKTIIDNLGDFLTDASVGAPGNKSLVEARTLEKEGKFTEAAAVLNIELKEHPDALVSTYAANLAAKAGNTVTAIQNIEKAIAMAPDNTALYEKAGELYQKAGSEGPKVFVNGVKPTFDTQPLVEDNRTLVPFRAIAESMGAQVKYESSTQTVTMLRDGTTVEMTIGSTLAKVDGKEVTLDVPPKIVNNRTVVPLRFVGESLKSQVNYDSATQIIKIQPNATPASGS
jgi:tetratricopeptide (TPR) repeat protein